MQFPKLTHLQSRFAICLLASLILVVLWFSLSNPHLAYAAELGPSGHEGAESYLEDVLLDDGEEWRGQGITIHWDDDLDELNNEGRLREESLEAQSQAVVKRIPEGTTALAGNNIPSNLNIEAGATQVWVFTNATLWGPHTPLGSGLPSELEDDEDEDGDIVRKELRKRNTGITDFEDGVEDDQMKAIFKRQSGSRTVYISINTCLQPSSNGSRTQSGAPPQLTLYVSMTSANTHPGPHNTGAQQVIPLVEGFANFSLVASSDVYISVSAPSLPSTFSGGWNYDLAASIDGYYHGYNNVSQFLFLVDSDTTSALLVSDNLTQADPSSTTFQQWMNLTTVPFTIFASNAGYSSIDGVRHSFCGLQNSPGRIMADVSDAAGTVNQVQMGMTTRGLGNKPKEQFYIRSLNGSSTYYGILAMQGNSTSSGDGVVGGGGQVWPGVQFTTKTDGNCALLFNLSFCSEVAYAVPANPATYPNPSSLSALYDSYAANLYTNFSKSLQQVPCNTTSTARYSLAKNCDDCAAAYKQWLCAVTIPRCEDFSSDLDFLQPRNLGQSFINGSMPDSVNGQPLDAVYVPMTGAPGGAAKPNWASALAANSSRNPEVIDERIMPGPYKELLP
ncbi:hypothetical protein H2203_006690, partial [Taxawa tesnikishii (nom. ined.)]